MQKEMEELQKKSIKIFQKTFLFVKFNWPKSQFDYLHYIVHVSSKYKTVHILIYSTYCTV